MNNVNWTRRLKTGAWAGAVALLLSAHAPASAQDARIAEAKKVGPVSFYTSLSPDELRQDIVAGFKKATGLDANIYYAGSGQLFSRLMSERRSGSKNVDVVTFADTGLVKELQNAKALKSFQPDANVLSQIPERYRGENGEWYGLAVVGLAVIYNEASLKGTPLPKSWADIASPEWKGRLVVADPARSAAGLMMIKAMVNQQGWDWVEKLYRNDTLIVSNGPGVDQAVASDERTIGAAVTAFASMDVKSGAPVKISPLDSLYIEPNTVSLVEGAPNPAGAALLANFMLSPEAAAIYAKYGYHATREDAPAPVGFPPLKELKVIYPKVESTMSRDEYLARIAAIAKAAKQ